MVEAAIFSLTPRTLNAYHSPHQGLTSAIRGGKVKTMTCRDVGVDCDFAAEGQTEQELMEKVAHHARADHGFTEIPPELMDKVKAAIHDKETAPA
jgi:predicted small metal-binding protein